jgi:hypothetical protein
VVYEDEMLEEDESLAARSSSLAIESNDLDREEEGAQDIRISRAKEPTRRRSSVLASPKKHDLTGSASSALGSPKQSYK